MSDNKTLAAALRARSLTPAGEVWARAKALVAKGSTPEQAADALAPHAAQQVTAAPYTAPAAPAFTAATVRRALKGLPVLPASKPSPKLPSFVGGQRVAITLSRTGEASRPAELIVGPARAKKRGTGLTHDVKLADSGELHTLSPAALARLLEGSGTRMAIGEVIWLMTRR